MADQTEDRLRVGVIGLGHWGPNIVRNVAKHPRATLVCVCDQDPAAFERVEGLAAPACRRVTDAAEVLEASDVDAVVVVTPAATHYALTKQALEAGKHVLCEKPLALEVAQAEEVCALAGERGLKLMVGHTFLFNSAVHKLKELVDTGRVGEIYYLMATRTHMGLVRRDVSVLWDLAPHDVVIMNYLVNALPERVSAVEARPLKLKWGDVAFVNLFYPNGVVGSLHVSWIDSHKERMVRVIGDKGRAVFNDLDDLEPIRLFEKGIGVGDRAASEFGEYRLLLRDGDIISPKVDSKEPLARMVDVFFCMVLDDASSPADGQAGLDVTRILVAAERSIERGGAPEPVT